MQRAIKELDYVVNEQARSLSGTSTKTVAILLDHLTSPFHNRVASGVEQEAAEQGRMCLISTTGGDPARELALIEMLRARNTEAVVLIGGVFDTPEYRSRIGRVARLLDASGSRLVLAGRPAPTPGLPVSIVEYDNEGGAYAAISYLLSMGHTRIAYLGPIPRSPPSPPGSTATDVPWTHGIAKDPALLFTTPAGVESRNLGYGAMRTLLDQGVESGSPRLPFTALFCYDDLVAAGAMAALRERGVSVPEDVSVVGYNDEPTALDVVPALTTVHISHIDLGRAALRLVLNHGNPQTVTLGDHISIATYLVIRDTVRRL